MIKFIHKRSPTKIIESAISLFNSINQITDNLSPFLTKIMLKDNNIEIDTSYICLVL